MASDMALYDDLGGATLVRAALGAFYSRVLADETLAPFFLGVDIERLKQVQEEFFAMSLGGPNTYTGRSLRDAHARTRRRGLNGTAFDHFVSLFKGVLVDLGVPAAQIDEWLTVFEGARGQILTR
jgi:hemoglobin